jgi:hypothetical protein
MKSIKTFFIVVCLILICTIASAKLYKWVDENGVTHYSNTAPPESSNVETLVETEADHSPGSHNLDSVLESYKRDDIEQAREESIKQAPKSFGQNDRLADYYEHKIKEQEAKIKVLEAEFRDVKRESFSDSISRNKRVRRYEYRLERAKLDLEHWKSEYKRAKYGE